MGIFDLFTTSQEKKLKELLDNKPQYLMHTSNKVPNKIYSIRPSKNYSKNQDLVFATDDEKLAILYTMYPFHYFEFGNGEIGTIIEGKYHDLLSIDKIVGYIYYLDSATFTPDVNEQGVFKHEWFSQSEVIVRKDITPKKITLEDVLKSGIQVFWVKDRATIMAINKETETLATGDLKLEFLINQTNWTPEKFMYINAYKNICPAIQTEKGWIVNKSFPNNLNVKNKTENLADKPQQVETQKINNNNNSNNPSTNSNFGYNINYQNGIPNINNYNNYSNQKSLNNYKK